MTPIATIAHRTQGRLRLRIAQKRKDLPFFLELYDHLRRIPCVNEVIMNPRTGSVLLHFDEQHRNAVIETLLDSPMIALAPQQVLALDKDKEPGRIERFLNERGTSATDPRTIIFLIMAGISVRQLFQGQIMAPVLTLVLYGFDFAVGLKTNTEQLEQPEQPA